MAAFLSPIGNSGTPFFTQQGLVLAGGMIYTYLAGTTTPQATWTTLTQSVPNSNPIVLNSAGLPPQEIWLQQGTSYKFVIQDAQGNTLLTLDNISGINDVSISPLEWIASNLTPTFIDGTHFSVPGNQTNNFQIGRRIQASVSAGTIYGTISNSVFSTVTTITVIWDTGALDSGLTNVSYALLNATHPSMPNAFNVQAFSVAGTFTYNPLASTVVCHVVVVGGGGGSSGVPSTGGAQVSAAGGGGGGACAQSYLTSAQSLAGTTVVVGAGGTAGAAGLNNGGNGGQSSFGALTAAGGLGAAATAAGAAPLIAGGGGPGVSAGGNIVQLQGQPGAYGLVVASGAGLGGQGGANGLGWPGVPGNTSGNPGIAGANAGTGGSGGCQANSGGALAGAAGKQGIVMIFEYA